MAVYQSAGIFVREVSSTIPIIQAVSASNMGIVGFTQRGPVDVATLVTSYNQFERDFGKPVKESLLPVEMAAYFNNGGQRAWVVRTMPADSEASDAQIQSQITDQVLFEGTGLSPLSAIAAVSVLKDNAGLSPLVPSSISVEFRAAAPAVISKATRNRGADAPLTLVNGQANYEGRIDPKATVVLAGAVSPNGDILYRSVLNGDTSITVEHIVAGINTPRSVSVVGTAITVNAATDGAGIILATETAASIATTVNTTPASAALVTAEDQGTGLGLIAAVAPTALTGGLPSFDARMDSAIRGTAIFNFDVVASTGGPTQIIAIPVGTSSIVSASVGDAVNGATITLDHRSGRFSVETHGDFIPAVADVGNPIEVDYTPASATKTALPTGAVNTSGALEIAHASLTPGIANTFINVVTGAWQLTFVAGPTNIAHNKAQIIVNYKINAWDLAPISNGIWGNDIKVDFVGSSDYFVAAQAKYTRFDLVVSLFNSNTNAFEFKESFTELVLDDADSVFYMPAVVNDASDFIRISTPGSLETIGALAGVARTQVLAGGDETTATNQELDTALTGGSVLLNSPIAPRSVTITYTDSTGTVRTITDDGRGNLVGHIDPAYAVISGALGPNKINYTTGQVNVRTLNPIAGSSLVVATYYSSPLETTHTERFGDTAKTYSYTLGATLVTFYGAGANGTFDSVNYGRDQFTNFSLLSADFKGMFALSKIDEIMQVVIPDFAGNVTISGDQLDYADLRATQPAGGDRFILLAPPAGSTAEDAVDWFRFDLGRFSKFAAIYAPWINVDDPLANNRALLVPPLAHVAGVFARTDQIKGVGKAPAGTEDGQLRGLRGVEFKFSQEERDLLQSNKINPIRSDDQVGTAVWGARTISLESEWKLVNVRRLFMFVERSIYNSTHWAVFENNGPALWSKIRGQLSSFLSSLFSQGQLGGNSPSEAFEVIVDETNNTPETILQGLVVVDVRLRPQFPAEFIEFRVSQIQITA